MKPNYLYLLSNVLLFIGGALLLISGIGFLINSDLDNLQYENVVIWEETCKDHEGIDFYQTELVLSKQIEGVRCNDGAYFTNPQ